MEEHKPEWYARARRGPFGKERFTATHADHVIRQIQEEQKGMKSHSGSRLRVTLLSAASFILLLGLGVFFLNGGVFEDKANTPTHAVVSSHLTEAELQRNAVQAMQKLLGKSYPLDHQEWLEEQQQIFFSYQKGEDSAYLWINYETGELVQAKMSTVLTASEIASKMKSYAEEIKTKLGYANDPAYDVLKYVEYDATQQSAVRIENNFRAEKWRIGFVNGEFDYASAVIEASVVSDDARQAGDKALKLLRGNEDDKLVLAFRTIQEEEEDTLTLNYGSEVAVTLDTATNKVQQVSDKSLMASDKTDAEQLTVLDRILSIIDGDRLREKAGPILGKLFGIADMNEYTLSKKDQEPGNLTFHKPGSPEITVYYDSDLTIWKVKQDSVANQL
jgi:hypothetical protein